MELTGQPRTTLIRHMQKGYCPYPRRSETNRSKNIAYKCWENMVQRATNGKIPKAKNYIERGIDIYPPWINNFTLFIEYIGERPGKQYSIDRIDNNKGYWPGNVRWATQIEQRNNQRVPCISEKYPLGIEKHGRYYRFKYKKVHYKFGTLKEAVIAKQEITHNRKQ